MRKEKLAFSPDIPTGSQGKDEKKTDEQERLEVVGRDALGREDHGSNKLTLRSSKTGAQDDAEASTIGSLNRGGDFGRRS